MFLLQKFREYKQNRRERSKRKITERELLHLNHKIDKLLVRLEEYEPEAATSPEDECVICISAKATMQTFPCGHRVVCRRCFVKTIQVAVSQRLLPLKCVICRTKILKLKQTSQGGINTSLALRSVETRITSTSNCPNGSSASATGTLYQLRSHSNLRCRNYSSSLSSASSHSCDSVYSSSSSSSSTSSSSSSSSIVDSVVSNSLTIQSQTGISSLFRQSNCFAKNNSGKGYKSNFKSLVSSKIYDASTSQTIGAPSSSSSSSSCTSSSSLSSRGSYGECKNGTSDTVTSTAKVASDNRWPMSMYPKSNILLGHKDASPNGSINSNTRKVIYSDRRCKGSNDWPFCRSKNARQVLSTCTSASSSNGESKVSFFASLSSSFSPCPSTVKKLTSHTILSPSNCSNNRSNQCTSGLSSCKVHHLDTKKKYNESLYHRRYSSYHKALRSSSIQASSSSSSTTSSLSPSSSPSPSASASPSSPASLIRSSSQRQAMYSSSSFNNSTSTGNNKSSFGNRNGSFESNRNKRSKLHQLDTSTSFYSNCYFYGNKVSTGTCDSPTDLSSASETNTTASPVASNLNGSTDHHYHHHHHHHHHHSNNSVSSNGLSHRSLNVSLIKSSTGSKSPNRMVESLLPVVLPKIDENTDEGEESDSSSENSAQLNETCNTFTSNNDNDHDDNDSDDDDDDVNDVVVETSPESLVVESEKDTFSDEKCHEKLESNGSKITAQIEKPEKSVKEERPVKKEGNEKSVEKNWQTFVKESDEEKSALEALMSNDLNEITSNEQMAIEVNDVTTNKLSNQLKGSKCTLELDSSVVVTLNSKYSVCSSEQQFNDCNNESVKVVEVSQSHLSSNQVSLNGQNGQMTWTELPNDKCERKKIIYPNLVPSSRSSSMQKLLTNESSTVQSDDELPGESSSSTSMSSSNIKVKSIDDELKCGTNSYLKLNESELKRKSSKFSFQFIGHLLITHLPSKSPEGKFNCKNSNISSKSEHLKDKTTTGIDSGSNNNNRIFYFSPMVSLLRRKVSSHSSDPKDPK